MTGHPEFLELVAASIDFDLTDEEFGRLNVHLTRCPECRRAAAELRGDAAMVSALPAPQLAPARAEQILRAALRTPRPQPRWGLLAVAAMLATLGGGVLFAGFQLINDDDPTTSEPPPSQVAEVSAPPSAEPAEDTAEPGAPDGGNPPAIDVPEPTPVDGDLGVVEFEFPLPFTADISNIRVAPASNDHLWVTFQRGSDTIGAELDRAGEGTPWVLPSATGCIPYAVNDGSVRLLCYVNEAEDEETCVDVCGGPRVYSSRGGDHGDGGEAPGFPVSLPSGISPAVNGGRVVGTDFVAVVTETYDEVVAEYGEFGSARLLTVAADGTVTEGANVPAPLMCCTIGPDGVAYGSTVVYPDDSEQQTQLVAFDANGMRPGWPIVVDGTASAPSFGPNGELVYVSWIDEASRIVRLNGDASPAADPVDLGVTVDWSPHFFDGPIPPLVDENGRVRIVAQGLVYGFDADGTVMGGFPYDPQTSLLERGNDCGPEETGCQSWIEPPRLAPRGLVYTLETAPPGMGGRINVVNPDGGVRSGWPVTLRRDGATWDSVTIGENRSAYAVAIEPEPGEAFSASILAFEPNGSRLWITTLVEP